MATRGFLAIAIVLILIVGVSLVLVRTSVARCQLGARYETAKRIEAKAVAAYSAGKYRQANDLFETAISEFGTFSPAHPVHDDSGMWLGLARWQEKQGDLRSAASGKQRVLDSRLGMWEFEKGCKL